MNKPVGSKEFTGSMAIMDRTGDTRLTWDYKNDDEVAAAKAMFDDLIKKGYRAFSVKKDGEAGERIDKFDPKAEKLIMVAQLQGG